MWARVFAAEKFGRWEARANDAEVCPSGRKSDHITVNSAATEDENKNVHESNIPPSGIQHANCERLSGDLRAHLRKDGEDDDEEETDSDEKMTVSRSAPKLVHSVNDVDGRRTNCTNISQKTTRRTTT